MATARSRGHTRSGEAISSCGAARMRVTPAAVLLFGAAMEAVSCWKIPPALFLRRHLLMDPSTSTEDFTTSKLTNFYNPSITPQAFTTSPESTLLLLPNSPVPHTHSLQSHHKILFEGHYFPPAVITSI